MKSYRHHHGNKGRIPMAGGARSCTRTAEGRRPRLIHFATTVHGPGLPWFSGCRHVEFPGVNGLRASSSPRNAPGSQRTRCLSRPLRATYRSEERKKKREFAPFVVSVVRVMSVLHGVGLLSQRGHVFGHHAIFRGGIVRPEAACPCRGMTGQ